MSPLRRAGIGLALGIAGAVLIYGLDSIDPYRVYQLSGVIYIAIAAAGLTVLTGLNGQLSLGHGALMAVGAYTTALMLRRSTDLNPALVMTAALIATSIVSIVVGIAAARLRGPYLAGATLALAVGLPGVAVRYSNVFGGDAGLSVPSITPPASLPTLAPEVWFAWVGLIPAVVTFVLLANLVSTRYGRDFRAIREDEIAAQLHGIRIARTQVIAFVLSGACAGLAGCLMAYTANLAAPAGFPLTLSLELLAAIVIGGIGRLPGAIWGALIIVFVPDLMATFNDAVRLPGSVRDQLPLALFGAVLIVAMLGFPHGIQGALDRLMTMRAIARVRSAQARRDV